MDSLSVIKMLKNKIFDRDCFYFYNVLQEFVHQHFSKRRNKNIFFKILKRYSKRSFYHGINGLNAKKSSHEIQKRNFFYKSLKSLWKQI